jgi:hypothetical protein
MKFTTITLIAAITSVNAFSPFGGGPKSAASSQKNAAFIDQQAKNQKPIFDPFGMYGKNSPERAAGIIKPLETQLEKDDAVVDPLNLYSDKSEVSSNADRSVSLPFLKRPEHLDGSLPGDRGFDPLNFSAGNASTLQWYRDSELRHSRIAMLAAVGWPIAELFHKSIAGSFGLPSILSPSDKVPSVLNGGLDMTNPLFWVGVLSATAALEFLSTKKQNEGTDALDFGFDPLGLGGKTEQQKLWIQEAEIFNGRIAMLAITGFAIQEFLNNAAVVNQTPVFFKPFGDVVAHLLESGAAGTSV